MEYKVYDGDLVGWTTCKIDKIINNGFRCCITTSDGTKLTRVLKEVNSEKEMFPDGCIYAIKKPTQN